MGAILLVVPLSGFIILFSLLIKCVRWCCKRCKLCKERAPPPLLPRTTSSTFKSCYATTIDGLSGMPVVMNINTVAAHQNQGNVVSPPLRTPINGDCNTTLYGTIIHGHPNLPSTLPPPNSER